MDRSKICTKCNEEKEMSSGFYQWCGRWRSECKKCTIKKNNRHQKKIKSWKTRHVDEDSRKIYSRQYYEKNKEKFEKYRATFNERHPEYYKIYFRNRREEKNASL